MRRLPWVMQMSPGWKRNTGEVRFREGNVMEAEIKVMPLEMEVRTTNQGILLAGC